jgi:endogenous inhibitor of DNA gyrase (YacG/DUF329 family)
MTDANPVSATPGDPGVRHVTCPGCGVLTPYHAGNPWRPFCGARCRGADLGAWASERYRLPADAAPIGDAAAPTN